MEIKKKKTLNEFSFGNYFLNSCLLFCPLLYSVEVNTLIHKDINSEIGNFIWMFLKDYNTQTCTCTESPPCNSRGNVTLSAWEINVICPLMQLLSVTSGIRCFIETVVQRLKPLLRNTVCVSMCVYMQDMT